MQGKGMASINWITYQTFSKNSIFEWVKHRFSEDANASLLVEVKKDPCLNCSDYLFLTSSVLHFNLILLHVFITFTRKVQNSISFQVVEIMTRKIGNGKKKGKKRVKILCMWICMQLLSLYTLLDCIVKLNCAGIKISLRDVFKACNFYGSQGYIFVFFFVIKF